MECNLKTKSSLTKYTTDFNTRYNTEESLNSNLRKRKDNYVKQQSKRYLKPLILRLDQNNKIEAVTTAYLNSIRKTETKKYYPSLNEAKQIQNLFQIDAFYI